MAKKTSKELFEEWRGKKVTFLGAPAIVVGYDLQFPNMLGLMINTDLEAYSFSPEALDPIEEFIDPTIETPYKRYAGAGPDDITLFE